MELSKRALADLTSLEELLYNDLQEHFHADKKRRILCQGAPGCDRTPIYGLKSKAPSHCCDHRTVDMVNVVHRLCKHPSMCFTQASFGYERNKPLYCKAHKLPDTLNVVSKRCDEAFCLMIPSFGYERGVALRCSMHKKPDMWNVSASTCKFLGCKTFATYGYDGKKSVRCSTHRLPDMRPTKVLASFEAYSTKPDVAKKQGGPVCRVCGIRAFYGNCETKRAFCKTHMSPDQHWRIAICDKGGCDKVATFSFEKFFLCAEHSTPFSAPVHTTTKASSCSLDGSDSSGSGSGSLPVNSLEEQVMQALL